ncbi:MAG TPA: hypothetical protein ENI96_04205 [Sedimenticola thiotaurini]|uniref:Uncharacterized protein n=1 Tax=Sedimenticola thiotaurini TaxID=1543721 RepID=A0A831W9Z2_9GAMM|nr:hypothetical protein [Sedimenticola thiotaurini]
MSVTANPAAASPRGRWRIAVLFLFLLLVAGCATQRGITEFTAYRDSYQMTANAGNAILDQLAVAERETRELVTGPMDTTVKVRFDPAEAGYYSSVSDPPATAALRRALQALELYNDALYGLASGQDAEVLAARLSRLGAIGASAAASIAGGPTIATGIDTAIQDLQPLVTFALGFKTRAEFRNRLLRDADTMRAILRSTRDGTREIYNLLLAKTVSEANASSDGVLSQEQREQAERVRALLANWVVLLEGSGAMLEMAVAAMQDTSGRGSSAGLVEIGSRLEAAARETRRNIAESAIR